jgi:hypothetical protein
MSKAAKAVLSANSMSRMTSGYGPPPSRPSPPVNLPLTSPVNTSRKNCRTFNPRRSGNPVYRKTGKPTFNSVSVCGPKPCPIPGQIRNASGCICPPGQEEVNGKCVSFCPSDKTRNASGNCVCPPGQEEVNGKCLPKCSAGTHREGDKCVPDCDPLKNDLVNGKCLPKCSAGTHREGDKCVPDCNLDTHEMINGKCLPKCSAGTHREGEKCVSYSPHIDLERPLTIETDVVLGGFEQSTANRTVIRQEATRSQVIIDPLKHKVTIGEYVLSGIPYSAEFINRNMGTKYTRQVNGVGKKEIGLNGIFTWALYIKKVSIKTETIGFDTKNGISIEFYPFDATNKIDKTPGKAGPTPVFIEIKPDSQGKVSYVQNKKPIYTTGEIMLETLQSALLPPKSGGRTKTTKRKHKYTRKSRKNNRKSRKQQRKTKNNRRK